MAETSTRRKIALIGFGKIAEYILSAFSASSEDGVKLRSHFQIIAIWNRTVSKLHENTSIDPSWILTDLKELHLRSPDIIVEVSHPDVLIANGEYFLSIADLFVGSPTAFADQYFFSAIVGAATRSDVKGSLYLPAGALWGSSDIAKMGERKCIASASITMKKPAHSMKLEEPLRSVLQQYVDDTSITGECVLYSGPVAPLCSLAPNNVNTMACFAVATQLGFDKVVGTLIADKSLAAHVIIAEVVGAKIPGREDQFRVSCERYNPCNPNEVTGIQTYASFLASLQRCFVSQGKGIHFI